MTFSVRGLLLSAAMALALAFAPASAAHDGADVTHGDPRSALPDSLVTQPVAQAEMASLEPQVEAAAAGPSLPETWCGTKTTVDDTEHATVAAAEAHFKLIYAHASNRPDRFADWDDRLQATVSLLGRYVASQSGDRKTLRWDMGTACGPQYVDIQVVHLPRTLSYYNGTNGSGRFSRLDADVRAAIGVGPEGPGSGPRDLLIYADGFLIDSSGTGIAGEGSAYIGDGADSPGFGDHDAGGLTSILYGPQALPSSGYAWPSVMLHEMTHNMGAVQLSAPHTSGAAHCDDRYDVMCYPDGGSSYNETRPCARVAGSVVDETYDCGNDDYFNPAPAAASYLATHWNVYRSAHLQPCSADPVACGVAVPDTTKPVNTTPPAPSWSKADYSVALSGADAGGVDAWAWRVDGGAEHATKTAAVTGEGSHTLLTRVRDSAGNWSDWRTDTVRIDKTAPTASVSCADGWQRDPQTCQAAGADARSGLARLEYQVGEGAVQTSPATPAGVAVDAEGTTTVRARAVDGAGNVSGWQAAIVQLDRTDPTAAVSCADGWSATLITCAAGGGDGGGSGLASLGYQVDGGPSTAIAAGQSFGVGTHGAHAIRVVASDGAGRTSDATDGTLVDLVAPDAAIACTALGEGRHRCVPTASDADSGVATLRLLRDGEAGSELASGSAVELGGPAVVAVSAIDTVGRATTSRAVTLAGRAATPASPVGLPRTARGTASLPGPGRGIGVLELIDRGGTRRVVATFRPQKLARGTYRLTICVRGTPCRSRTVRLRRAGRPRALRIEMAAPPGEVAASFTLWRKRGARLVRQGSAATSARLG